MEDLREAHAALDQSQGGQTGFDRDVFRPNARATPTDESVAPPVNPHH